MHEIRDDCRVTSFSPRRRGQLWQGLRQRYHFASGTRTPQGRRCDGSFWRRGAYGEPFVVPPLKEQSLDKIRRIGLCVDVRSAPYESQFPFTRKSCQSCKSLSTSLRVLRVSVVILRSLSHRCVIITNFSRLRLASSFRPWLGARASPRRPLVAPSARRCRTGWRAS
jgi:hypothetical protein